MGYASALLRQLTFKPKPVASSIRLDGKTAIITGASSGLGLGAAKELAAHGISRLILGIRNAVKGEEAKTQILAQLPAGTEVEVWPLDYESFDSLEEFSRRAAALDRLDIVILCAAVKNPGYIKSPTGLEQHIQVNHIGTALLSIDLLGPLSSTARIIANSTRLTIVSSESHFFASAQELKADNALRELNSSQLCFQGFAGANMERYNTTKLLNVLWTRELSKRAEKAGMNVVINTLNPGCCKTELHHAHSAGAMIAALMGWTSEQGGYLVVDAAVLHEGETGAYLSEAQIRKPSPFVLSSEGAAAQLKIWNETVALLLAETRPQGILETLQAS